MFQSTRRGARQLFKDREFSESKCFNPRAHVGRDAKCESFNPRARVGRDGVLCKGLASRVVSIHVGRDNCPLAWTTWGATAALSWGVDWGAGVFVSIHAPAWGATAYWVISLKSSTKVVIFAKRKNKKENWI
jgi:hypothetical protein